MQTVNHPCKMMSKPISMIKHSKNRSSRSVFQIKDKENTSQLLVAAAASLLRLLEIQQQSSAPNDDQAHLRALMQTNNPSIENFESYKACFTR